MINKTPCRYFRSAIPEKGKINETPCRYFRSAIPEKGMINEKPCRYFRSAIPEKGMINEKPCRYFRSAIPEKGMINETPCRYFRSVIPEKGNAYRVVLPIKTKEKTKNTRRLCSVSNFPYMTRISQRVKRGRRVCLFVLRFYGPVNPMGSCRARSVYLTTRLLGRLSPLSG